jgi:hypothetical protein
MGAVDGERIDSWALGRKHESIGSTEEAVNHVVCCETLRTAAPSEDTTDSELISSVVFGVEQDTPELFDLISSTGIHTPSPIDGYLRFYGHFSHPDFGENISVDVILESSTSGKWTIEQQTEELEIRFHQGHLIFSERNGPTEFDGTFDPKSGLYAGEVIQDGVRDGRLHLQLHQSFLRISALSPQKVLFPEDVKVVAIDIVDGDREIASFSRHGLETVGEVIKLLQNHFGCSHTGNVRAVVRSNGLLRAQSESERLHHRSHCVYVMGFDIALLRMHSELLRKLKSRRDAVDSCASAYGNNTEVSAQEDNIIGA